MRDLEHIRSTVDSNLWRVDTDTLPWWKRTGIQISKFIYVMGRDMSDGQLNLRAMSLVYTTLLSLVPLLAISFSVLKGFGVHNQVGPFLRNALSTLGDQGIEIADYIIDFVDNIQVGVLGAVGLGLLVYTVISLMQKIESAFNFTWRVSADRTMGRKFTSYLSVLLIGPLLVFSSFGMTATMTASPFMKALVEIAPLGWAIGLAGQLIPYVMVVLAFAFMYFYMPNTRVRVSSAFVGALVGGALWVTVGWAFTTFVVASTSYTAIYSAFATLILFMMWLYMSWLVLLVGAAVAFYFQHPECLIPLRNRDIHLSPRMREKVTLQVMTLVARRFYQGKGGWMPQELAMALHVPVYAIGSVIEALESAGFLCRTERDEDIIYLPARPMETTLVADVLEAGRAAFERKPYLSFDRLPADPAVDQTMARLRDERNKVLGEMTMKDLALAETKAEKPTTLRSASGG
jgi:membrane protein